MKTPNPYLNKDAIVDLGQQLGQKSKCPYTAVISHLNRCGRFLTTDKVPKLTDAIKSLIFSVFTKKAVP